MPDHTVLEDKALIHDGVLNQSASPEDTSQHPVSRKRSKALGHWLALYQHYLTPALIAMILGIGWSLWMTHFSANLISWTIFCGLTCLLLGTLCLSWRHDILRWSIWILMFLVGLGYGTFRSTLLAASPWQHVGNVNQAQLEGVVTGAHLRGKKMIWDIEIATLQDQQGQRLIDAQETLSPPKIQAMIPKALITQEWPLPVGHHVQLVGVIRPPFTSDLPGAFHEADYLKSQGISWVMHHVNAVNVNDLSVNDLNSSPALTSTGIITLKEYQYHSLALFGQMRDRVANGFQQALPSPFHEVLGGLVLGSHAIPLDKEVRHAFIDTGMIHILAASGMNVAIIAGVSLFGFKGLLQLLRFANRRLNPKRNKKGLGLLSSENAEATAIILTMLCVLLYAGMTGLPPSILRAGGMIELALFLKLLNREARPLTILSVCVLIICLLDPFILGNIGFQLSVLSSLGLVLMIPPLSRWLSPWIGSHLAGGLLVPIVAQWWVFPLTVYYFNQFPLHAIPLNIFAAYLITPLTMLGFISGGIILLYEPLGVLLAQCAYPLLWILLWTFHAASQWEWAKWSLPSLSQLSIGTGYTALAVLSWLCLTRRTVANGLTLKRKVAVGMAMLSLWAGVTVWDRYQQLSQFQIAHLPLGRSRTMTIVQWPSPSPRVTLIAPAQLNYWQEQQLMAYLKHKGLSSYLGEIIIHTPSENSGLENLDYKWVKRLTVSTKRAVPVLIWGNPQTISQEVVYGVAEDYWMKGLGENQIWHSQNLGPDTKAVWRDTDGLNFRQNDACLRIQEHSTQNPNPIANAAPCALSIQLDSKGSASILSIQNNPTTAHKKHVALNHYLEARLGPANVSLVK